MASKKRKILYLITKSNWGGAQQYVHEFATSLPKEEFDVVVALGGTGTQNASPGLLAEKLHDHHVRTIVVSAFMRDMSPWKDSVALFELLRLFRAERPDIVHLNSSKAGGLGALAGRMMGVPCIIFTSHGLAYDEDRDVFSRLLRWAATWLTFILCHRVITISKDTYVRARKFLFCSKKIHLVHNGIAPILFLARNEARSSLQIPPRTCVIGTIAELTHTKNLDILLQAAEKLRRDGLRFFLMIFGEGELRASLEAHILKSGLTDCVRLAGFIPSAAHYLKAFDVFVLPSVKEGLPYVLLEAGQAELPVVGSAIPGVVDIIHHKKTGLLFSPQNAEDLAACLAELLEDASLRKQYGASLAAHVQNEFSTDTMIAETLALYRSCA